VIILTKIDPEKCDLVELGKNINEWIKNPTSHPEIERLGNDINFKTKTDKDFKKYYQYYEKARALEKDKKENEALKIYLNILDKYTPMGTAYYERPAIILERQKRYKEAIMVCKQAIKAINKDDFHATPEEFEYRLDRLNNKIAKQKTTKAITTKKKAKNKPVKSSSKNIITATQAKEVSTPNIKFPDWYVSISFGESKSPSFPQALALAQNAPQYIENKISGRILYQAVYSDKPIEYLQFIKLYELVSKWTSCFVIMNGTVMDRKIVGKLNYCYGDKCRSGNPDFCFGASEMTSNPFGCHRLQISTCNHPWWSIGTFLTPNIWHVDKKAILERIETYSLPYVMCPSFSIKNIKEAVKSLPDEIDLSKNKNWEKTYNDIHPKNLYNVGTVKIDLNEIKTNQKTISDKKEEGFFSKLKSLFNKK
jgi:tetratricopeptide (TPR) repeat protein